MINKLAQLLADSKYCVIISGAGMSTESGLPDFRSRKDGLWAKRNPTELASTNAMKNNRDEFISFYRERMNALVKVHPHAGYEILANWANDGLIKATITQNVDGFHTISGQQNVAELHGSLRTCHCNSCRKNYPMDLFMSSDQLLCECGGFIRPSVVLFGESLPLHAFEFSEKETEKADLFIVLGSSLQVSPANMFPKIAKQNGAKLVIVNMEPTPLDPIADLVINDRKLGEVITEVNLLINEDLNN